MLACAALITVAAPAHASVPLSAFAVPSKVEFLPGQPTATHVVIHGAFFFYTGMGNLNYSSPKCGYMYFTCKPGEEAMCRMQWNEIHQTIGKGS
ncbi:MAG: hypothetical protein EXR72_16155 [Myxococcales bacterium]|nr:hypothetical protein [Myxococcales bacterium]